MNISAAKAELTINGYAGRYRPVWAAKFRTVQVNGGGSKRDNPRPIAADLYGGEGARADYDAVLTLYRPEKYKKEREDVAAKPSDWATINRVFPGDIEGIAEIAAIKVRFGDPTIRERLRFEARFTRYVSMQSERERELF